VLIDEPTLQLLSGEQWLLDDDFISFVARRWSSTDSDATVVEGGIYVLPMVYDADGNTIGLGEQPTSPTIPLPMVLSDEPNFDGVEHPRPDLRHYSWAPDGAQFVHNKSSESGVWVADVLSGTETKISADPGHNPQWSPDGDTIVYGDGWGLFTIKPNGKRRTRILQKTSTWTFIDAYFSPDSQYLVFTGQSFESTGINHDVFRMNVNGGDLVNLTDTPGPTTERTFSGNAGWR
jgi:Tol biopolymer transport system component